MNTNTSNNNSRQQAIDWWDGLSVQNRCDLKLQYHIKGTPLESTMEGIYKSEHPSILPTIESEGKDDLLDIFIKEIRDEFKDENWDYLTFIADRVRSKTKNEMTNKSIFEPLLPLMKENAQIKERVKTLEGALKDILDNWKGRMAGDEETFKTPLNSDIPPYWSPSASMVSSEFIAAAKKVLKNK